MNAILSVDDSAVMRKMIGRVVQVLGFELLEAGNGLEALEVLEREHQRVALVIMDINMPEMDGMTTLEHIKAHETYKSLPVMMLTTDSDRNRVIQAIQFGASNYMTKPFRPEDLTTKIAECLGLSFDFE